MSLHSSFARLRRFARILIPAIAAVCTAASSVRAEPVVKMQAALGVSFEEGVIVLAGSASHLGSFVGFGELDFIPGELPGTAEGVGVAVLHSANGDLLVGVIGWVVDENGNGILDFSWRDSVELRDGSVFFTTGRFARNRPGGTSTLTGTTSDKRTKTLNLLNQLRQACSAEDLSEDLRKVCENGEKQLLDDLSAISP